MLGELENLVESLLAHILAAFVLALESHEACLRVSRSVMSWRACSRLLSCFQDGLGESVDITSGLIHWLGGTIDQIQQKKGDDDRSTYHRLRHVGG